jgi:hypothetical protein
MMTAPSIGGLTNRSKGSLNVSLAKPRQGFVLENRSRSSDKSREWRVVTLKPARYLPCIKRLTSRCETR